jgi:DNA-binding XRE family transcriptional regulator
MVTESQRILIIRALVGLNQKSLAAELGVRPLTVGLWEAGKTTPQAKQRLALAELCKAHGICFTPTGMPVPLEDFMAMRTQDDNHPA